MRREDRAGSVSALSGVPQTRIRTGALSGKTIYLSPGHGFYRSSPLGRWATQRGNTNGVVEDLVSIETLNQYLLPMLMGAGATVIPVRESDLNPRMVILNNGGEGYSEEGPAGLFSTSTLPGWGPPPVPMGNAVQPFELGGNRLMTAAPTATAQRHLGAHDSGGWRLPRVRLVWRGPGAACRMRTTWCGTRAARATSG